MLAVTNNGARHRTGFRLSGIADKPTSNDRIMLAVTNNGARHRTGFRLSGIADEPTSNNRITLAEVPLKLLKTHIYEHISHAYIITISWTRMQICNTDDISNYDTWQPLVTRDNLPICSFSNGSSTSFIDASRRRSVHICSAVHSTARHHSDINIFPRTKLCNVKNTC